MKSDHGRTELGKLRKHGSAWYNKGMSGLQGVNLRPVHGEFMHMYKQTYIYIHTNSHIDSYICLFLCICLYMYIYYTYISIYILYIIYIWNTLEYSIEFEKVSFFKAIAQPDWLGTHFREDNVD
jgi:hypothetical protein